MTNSTTNNVSLVAVTSEKFCLEQTLIRINELEEVGYYEECMKMVDRMEKDLNELKEVILYTGRGIGRLNNIIDMLSLANEYRVAMEDAYEENQLDWMFEYTDNLEEELINEVYHKAV